jgi:hypothetical protein
LNDKFCPNCGDHIVENPVSSGKPKIKTISSAGTYSGKIIKSKTSKTWKIIRNLIIVTIVSGIIALIIWFQVDPDAGKKLTDALLGIGFMAVFFFVGWLFMRGKKGKKSDWDDDQYGDLDDDND